MDDRTTQIKLALEKQQPKPAQRFELGGDYYYKCFWLSCNADVKKMDNYCPVCGQRLSFD